MSRFGESKKGVLFNCIESLGESFEIRYVSDSFFSSLVKNSAQVYPRSEKREKSTTYRARRLITSILKKCSKFKNVVAANYSSTVSYASILSFDGITIASSHAFRARLSSKRVIVRR